MSCICLTNTNSKPTVTPILQRKTDPDSAANILMIWAEYLLQETVFKCVSGQDKQHYYFWWIIVKHVVNWQRCLTGKLFSVPPFLLPWNAMFWRELQFSPQMEKHMFMSLWLAPKCKQACVAGQLHCCANEPWQIWILQNAIELTRSKCFI